MTTITERVRRFVERHQARKLEKSTANLTEWLLQQRDAHQFGDLTFKQWATFAGDAFEDYNYRGLPDSKEQDLISASTLSIGKIFSLNSKLVDDPYYTFGAVSEDFRRLLQKGSLVVNAQEEQESQFALRTSIIPLMSSAKMMASLFVPRIEISNWFSSLIRNDLQSIHAQSAVWELGFLRQTYPSTIDFLTENKVLESIFRGKR